MIREDRMDLPFLRSRIKDALADIRVLNGGVSDGTEDAALQMRMHLYARGCMGPSRHDPCNREAEVQVEC